MDENINNMCGDAGDQKDIANPVKDVPETNQMTINKNQYVTIII